MSRSASGDRYGEWPSPISAARVAQGSGGVSWPSCVGAETWWCSSDPSSGAVTLQRCHTGVAPTGVLPSGWSVRNSVIGYGGRPYLAVQQAGGVLVIFTNGSDQRLYAVDVATIPNAGDQVAREQSVPHPLTPPAVAGETTAFADPVLAPDAAEVWCVREVTSAGRTRRDVVAVPLSGSAASGDQIRVVAQSHHFLSGIRISPDGRRLAWIGWDHPQMPWDGTDVMVADLVAGQTRNPRCVYPGVAQGVSVPQVEWSDDDSLVVMADPSGWWSLHRIDLTADPSAALNCLVPMAEECADALWRVGATWFAVTAHGIVFRHGVGEQQLAVWDRETGSLASLAPGWQEFGSSIMGTGPTAATAAVAVVAGSTDRTSTVLRVPVPPVGAEPPTATACVPESDLDLKPWNPAAQRRVATGSDGREVHYVYYPPTNPAMVPAGGPPPLLVDVHGGPTSATGATPDLEFGLFCSRGFALVSVDYGGSTGYGREYRQRLRHGWGEVDVEDCATVARAMIADGLADPDRIAIRGGSAGGWTALASLASTDLYCAGAVYYPIADPLTWSGEWTHDFESRYLDSLIGELPDALDQYRAVSPLANADRIARPLVMLQGADDRICRPDQASRLIESVAARGLWHRHLVFPGEGHGFRLQSSVEQSLLAEAELYSHAMGITVDLGETTPADRSETSQ